MSFLFKIISLLEGISYILLLFVAVPIKYLLDAETSKNFLLINNDFLVKILGMPHGIFFLLYCLLALLIKKNQAWNNTEFTKVLIASLVPFGTFYINSRYLDRK